MTYPRSGTTWTQMILYQLTTDGRMDFAHITQVCPWFERALKAGRDLDALPAPRVFKSHLTYRRIPKGPCRYIYVARDGKDVAVSYYHFYRSHMGYKGTFEEFFERFLTGERELRALAPARRGLVGAPRRPERPVPALRGPGARPGRQSAPDRQLLRPGRGPGALRRHPGALQLRVHERSTRASSTPCWG